MSPIGIEVIITTLRRARVTATLRRRSPPVCPSTPKLRRKLPWPLRPKVEEDDHVALVALHVLHVLHEHAHVLAVFAALALLAVGGAERLVLLGTQFQALLDEVGLLAVEGDHAHRRPRRVGLAPEFGEVVDDSLGLALVALVLVQAVHLDQLQRLDAQYVGLRMAYRHAQAVAVERGVGKADQLAVGRAVVDLQGGAGQGVARQLQEVRAVLDLAAVPGVLVGFALLLVGVLVGRFAVEQLGLVAFHAAGEERGRRHLLLVAADHRDPPAIKGRQGELHRHLRGFVVDHHVEQPGLERQHAAGQVGVHQPDRAQAHQAEFGAQLDELAQAPRALAGQAGDVFPLLAAAQARGVDALAEQFAVQRAHLHVGFGEAGDPGPGFVLAEQQFRIVLFQALLPAQPCFAIEHAAHRGFECFGGNRVELFLALAQQGQEFQVGGFELAGAATEALVGDQLRQRLAQAAEGRQVALVAGDGAVQLFQQFVAEPVGEHLQFVQAELACGLADQRGVEVAEQRFEALFLAGEDHRVELLGARRARLRARVWISRSCWLALPARPVSSGPASVATVASPRLCCSAAGCRRSGRHWRSRSQAPRRAARRLSSSASPCSRRKRRRRAPQQAQRVEPGQPGACLEHLAGVGLEAFEVVLFEHGEGRRHSSGACRSRSSWRSCRSICSASANRPSPRLGCPGAASRNSGSQWARRWRCSSRKFSRVPTWLASQAR